jgi:tRNA modification GTPase
VTRARTIAAIASPPGGARRGIVRISGPRAGELVAAALAHAEPPFDRTAERALVRGELDDGRGRQPVSVLWMRAPRSYTREDVAELHLPGAEPLLARALARLLELGAAPAHPGEFTRRAFENGRLDLAQCEAVLALSEAAHEEERRAALALLEGGLGSRARAIRDSLVELLALCEAGLDFDESETGHVPHEELRERAVRCAAALDEALRREGARAAPPALPRVVLVGAPGAGKSTLWNALTGGRALVGERPGTTRDALAALWELGATTVLLVDGPGVEDARSRADATARRLFDGERERADLVLWVVDASQPGSEGEPPSGACLRVLSKADLPATVAESRQRSDLPSVLVSARAGTGLGELARAVAAELGGRTGEGGIARQLVARHRQALERARAELGRAVEGLDEGRSLDVLAEGLRTSLEALDELSGRTAPDDVLDVLFARFCIGK